MNLNRLHLTIDLPDVKLDSDALAILMGAQLRAPAPAEPARLADDGSLTVRGLYVPCAVCHAPVLDPPPAGMTVTVQTDSAGRVLITPHLDCKRG